MRKLYMDIAKTPIKKIKLPDNGMELTFSVCPDSNCDCGTIFLESEDENFPVAGRLQIAIYDREIFYDGPPDEDVNDIDLEKFWQSLSINDWEFLLKSYMDTKTRMAEEAPLSMNGYFFDFEAIEKEKEMIQYGEVFPCENNMLIDFGAKRLLLCDMYCLNPACNCQDSIIEIFDTEPESGLLSYGGFTVNYHQSCWGKYIPGGEPSLDDIPIPVLRALAENQIPDFYKKLEERHKKLRQLYRLPPLAVIRLWFGQKQKKEKQKTKEKDEEKEIIWLILIKNNCCLRCGNYVKPK